MDKIDKAVPRPLVPARTPAESVPRSLPHEAQDTFERVPPPRAKTLKEKYDTRLQILENIGPRKSIEACQKEIQGADQIKDPEERKMRLSLAHFVLAKAAFPREPSDKAQPSMMNYRDLLFHLSNATKGISPESLPEWMSLERLLHTYFRQLNAAHNLLLHNRLLLNQGGQADIDPLIHLNNEAQILANLRSPSFTPLLNDEVKKRMLSTALELSHDYSYLSPESSRVLLSIFLDAIEKDPSSIADNSQFRKESFASVVSQAFFLKIDRVDAKKLLERIEPNLEQLLNLIKDEQKGQNEQNDVSVKFLQPLGPFLFSYADWKTAGTIFNKLAEFYKDKNANILVMLYLSVAYCAQQIGDHERHKEYEAKTNALLKKLPPNLRKKKEKEIAQFFNEIQKKREEVLQQTQGLAKKPAAAKRLNTDAPLRPASSADATPKPTKRPQKPAENSATISVLASTYVPPPEAPAVTKLTKAQRDELAKQASSKRGARTPTKAESPLHTEAHLSEPKPESYVNVENNQELIAFLNRLVKETPASYEIRTGKGSHAQILCKVGDKEFPIFTSGHHGGSDRFSPDLAKQIGETLGRLKDAAEAANRLKLIESKMGGLKEERHATLTPAELYQMAQRSAPQSRATRVTASVIHSAKKAAKATKNALSGSGKQEKKEK